MYEEKDNHNKSSEIKLIYKQIQVKSCALEWVRISCSVSRSHRDVCRELYRAQVTILSLS